VVVMPHRWAGLLSMCRSFLSVLKKREKECRIIHCLYSSSYFSLVCCYELCLLISIANMKVVMCSSKFSGLMYRKISIFSQSAIFCKGLSSVQMEGRKKVILEYKICITVI